MRNFVLSSFVCTALIASTGAQITFTTPPGAFHTQYAGTSSVIFGGAAGYMSRLQQADSNFIGEARLPFIRSIAWRRYGLSVATATPRTAEVTILMSHTDYATFSATFASNYKDTPVTVFPRTTINLPDWTIPAPPPLPPFDLVVPFTIPFTYNRVDAFLFEVVVTNTGAGGAYSQNWFAGPATQDWSMTIQERAGCTTPNGAFKKRDGYRTNGTALEVGWELTAGPSNAAATVLLGAQLTTLTIPGLCSPLSLAPLVSIPLGSTDATGALALGSTLVTWDPGMAAAELTAQGAALDPSQSGIQIALSNATRTVLPKVLGVPGVNCKRTLVQNSSNATTGTTPTVTAVPTQFSY